MSVERLDKRRNAKKRRKYAPMMACVIILSFILIGLAAFHNLCKLENIEIKGVSYYTEEDIEKLVITSETDRYAPLLYLKGRLSTMAEAPFIDKLDIELLDRNSVCIYVYEKAIIGCVEKMGQYMYFDNEGIIIEASSSHDVRYPLVTGLKFDSIVMNKKLEVERDNIFGTILDISMLIKKNELVVSQMNFSGSLEVTLYCDDDIVLLGKRTTYDLQLNNLPSILATTGEGRFRLDMKEYSENNMKVVAKLIE